MRISVLVERGQVAGRSERQFSRQQLTNERNTKLNV